MFIFSTCATKCSVLLFYRRMVKDTYSRSWLYAIWAALGFTGGYFLATLLALCLVCRPLSAYWESYDLNYTGTYTCINGNVLSPMVGVLSVVSDLYAVLLPFLMLRQYDLNVSRRQRIALDAIFALGLLVAGAGIGRTYYLWKIDHTYDTSWAGFDLFACSLVECHLAVICACAPSLRAFFRRYLSEVFRRTSKGSSYARRQGGAKDSQLSAQGAPSVGGALLANQYMGWTQMDERQPEQLPIEEMRPAKVKGDIQTRDRLGEASPQIGSAEDYEEYAMRNLRNHSYKRSDTTSPTDYYNTDSQRQQDFHGAV